MFRSLALLIPLSLIACSQDRPAPLAPAGKATDTDLGDLFTMFGHPAPLAQDDPDSLAPADFAFQIELVYMDSFTVEQKEWMQTVAQQWEIFFDDIDDYTVEQTTYINVPDGSRIVIPSQTVIDDIRIYVGKITPSVERTLAANSGWSNISVTGVNWSLLFRDDGATPLVAKIAINADAIEEKERSWKNTFHHELGHAFGIGNSKAWIDQITYVGQTPYYTGANALREYRARGLNDKSINRNPNGIRLLANWGKTPIHWTMANGMHGHLFMLYWMRDNDMPNISTVTLGAFEDMGWNVKYEMGMTEFPELDDLQLCHLTFYLCN